LGFIRAIYRDISWTGPYAPTFNFSAGCALICILLFEAGHLNESKALTSFSTCSTDQKNETLWEKFRWLGMSITQEILEDVVGDQ
jgi:hypothetical protein